MSFDDQNIDMELQQRDLIDVCLDILYVSPAARRMISEADKEGWRFSMDDRGGYDFHLDVTEKHVILDNQGLAVEAIERSDHFRNLMMVSMIRALRDIWQEKRHGAFDVKYSPENVLLLERVRAADCDVLAALVAWELRSEGQGGLWRHMIGSEEGDIAMAFSGYMERDPSSLFTGAPLVAAFNQWFRDEERVNQCDHETLEYMDILIEDNDDVSFGSERLSAVGLEILSCLPDKTAYLQGRGREIMFDPFYAGLNNEINQSHFTQILYDLQVTYVQDVPFRDKDLAFRIFPDGCFTDEL